MNRTALDDIIDIALDQKDVEWAKHLAEIKYNINNKALVVEDMMGEYALLEDGVLKNIDNFTEDSIMNHTMVRVNKFRAKSGDTAEYTVLSVSERYFLFGYYTGKGGYSSSTFLRRG